MLSLKNTKNGTKITEQNNLKSTKKGMTKTKKFSVKKLCVCVVVIIVAVIKQDMKKVKNIKHSFITRNKRQKQYK